MSNLTERKRLSGERKKKKGEDSFMYFFQVQEKIKTAKKKGRKRAKDLGRFLNE